MKVRYSETALRELDDIFAYIYERDRKAAAAVVDRVETLAGMLETFPLAGQPTDEPGVRFIPLVRFPFRIFYVPDVASGTVVIVHVRHTAMPFPGEAG